MSVVGRGADQYTVRFPDGLRDRVKAAADAAGRSMNAEIIAALEKAFPGPALDVERILKEIHAIMDDNRSIMEDISQTTDAAVVRDLFERMSRNEKDLKYRFELIEKERKLL